MNYINFELNFFLQLLLSILGIVFFGLIYFLFTYLEHKEISPLIKRYKVYLLSFAMSTFAVLWIFFLNGLNIKNSVLIINFDISIFLAFTIFYNWKFIIFNIPAILINFFVFQDSKIYILIWISAFIIAYATILLLNSFSINKYYKASIVLVIILALPLVANIIFNIQDSKIIFYGSLIDSIVYAIAFAAIILINNFFKKTSDLQLISEYEVYPYLKSNNHLRQIKRKIEELKLENGIYFLIHIDLDNILTEQNKKIILKRIQSDLIKILAKNKDVLFFFENKNTIGFFMPTKFDLDYLKISYKNNDFFERTPLDPLFYFYKKLSLIPSKFVIGKEEFNININIASSIYGIHSNSLEEINDFCNFGLSQSNYLSKNVFYIYNPYDLYVYKKEKNNIKLLKNEINLSNFEIIKNDVETNTIFISYKYYDYSKDYKKLAIILKDKNLNSILFRYLGRLSLKEFETQTETTNKKILIPYDANYVSSKQFDAIQFISKIIKYKIEFKTLGFVFNMSNFKGDINKLFNSIKELKSFGLSIGLINVNDFSEIRSLTQAKLLDYVGYDTKHFSSLEENEDEIISMYEKYCEIANAKFLMLKNNNNYIF